MYFYHKLLLINFSLWVSNNYKILTRAIKKYASSYRIKKKKEEKIKYTTLLII